MKNISTKALYEFCASYRQQFGRFHDALQFANELRLRFFTASSSEDFFMRCIREKFIKELNGNIIIKV